MTVSLAKFSRIALLLSAVMIGTLVSAADYGRDRSGIGKSGTSSSDAVKDKTIPVGIAVAQPVGEAFSANNTVKGAAGGSGAAAFGYFVASAMNSKTSSTILFCFLGFFLGWAGVLFILKITGH